jgi:hypothetical protein
MNWHEAAQAWLEAVGLGTASASLVYSFGGGGYLLDSVVAFMAKEDLFEKLKKGGGATPDTPHKK